MTKTKPETNNNKKATTATTKQSQPKTKTLYLLYYLTGLWKSNRGTYYLLLLLK